MKTQIREENRKKVCSILGEILEEDQVLFEENARLAEDIGLDSMGFLELAIQIQRTFDLLIPNEDWKKIQTLEDLLNKLEEKQDENA